MFQKVKLNFVNLDVFFSKYGFESEKFQLPSSNSSDFQNVKQLLKIKLLMEARVFEKFTLALRKARLSVMNGHFNPICALKSCKSGC